LSRVLKLMLRPLKISSAFSVDTTLDVRPASTSKSEYASIIVDTKWLRDLIRIPRDVRELAIVANDLASTLPSTTIDLTLSDNDSP